MFSQLSYSLLKITPEKFKAHLVQARMPITLQHGQLFTHPQSQASLRKKPQD